APAPVLAGRPALALVFERVELIDGDRRRADEVVRALRREDGAGEPLLLVSLQIVHPGQVDRGQLLRRYGDLLVGAVRAGDRDVRRSVPRVGHDGRKVEDRIDDVPRDGGPVVATDVRLRGRGLLARDRISGRTGAVAAAAAFAEQAAFGS